MKTCWSDSGKLILLENDYFVIVRGELTWLLILKVLNWWWIEKFKCKKNNFIEVEFMVNGEFKCCLYLLIVCIQRITIDFRDTDGVSLVGEVKI